jgi:hypothetical protein
MSPDAVRHEQHRGVVRAAEEVQAVTGQQIGCVEIGLQYLEPEFIVVVAQRCQCTELGGIMDQAVQPPELLCQRFRKRRVIRRSRTLEIHGVDGGLRRVVGDDLVVERLQAANIPVQQHNRGAVSRATARQSAPNAVGGAGDQHDACSKMIGAG